MDISSLTLDKQVKLQYCLFAGSPKGAAESTGIYTLVETAKANELAPMKYIKYILVDMPGSAFLEHPEYLDDYLLWNPMVKELCQ